MSQYIDQILTKLEIICQDLTRIRDDPPDSQVTYDQNLKLLIDETDECATLCLKEQKRKREEDYRGSAAAKQDYSLLHPPKKMKIFHEVTTNNLPNEISEKAMMSTLTQLADDEDLGPLKYISFNKMNNGTFCLNIQGMCPVHKRDHDGGGKLWQIQQKKDDKNDCFLKCWVENGYKKIPRLPLF